MQIVRERESGKSMLAMQHDDDAIYFEECIFRQQVIIQASFVKDDGILFVYYF